MVSRSRCSSVKKFGVEASISMTPMTRFLMMSGIASSERTPTGPSMKFGISRTSLTRTGSRLAAASPVTPWPTFTDPLCKFWRMTYLEAYTKILCFLIQQENGKYFVVKHFANEFRDTTQQCVEVERRVNDVGHLQQEGIHTGRSAWLCGRVHSETDHDNSRQLIQREGDALGPALILTLPPEHLSTADCR